MSAQRHAYKLAVKAVPGASRDEISGWLGERLKIRVRVPPEGGKANTAICKLLAKSLDLPRSAVAITAGGSSPLKTVTIQLSSSKIPALLTAP